MIKATISSILSERSEIETGLRELKTLAERGGYYAYNPSTHKLITGHTYQSVDEKAVEAGLVPDANMLQKSGFVHGNVDGRGILIMGAPLLVRAFVHQLYETRRLYPFTRIRFRNGDKLDLMDSDSIVKYLR
tara:strand:+ start:881 stop:1276 length:396 start_codon:yes stop_codon:yes gene_type:complete